MLPRLFGFPLFTALLLLVSLTASIAPGASVWPAEGDDDAMPLLRWSAKAGERTSYEGVQSVAIRNGGDTATERVKVVHRAGKETGAAGVASVSAHRGQDVVVGHSASPLRLDATMLRTLGSNYRVTRAGNDVLDGRDVAVVEARRADGTVAGRFWIDDATALPLRKETRDAYGRVAQSTGFVQVEVGEGIGAVPGTAKHARPWGAPLSKKKLAELRDSGWVVPEHLSSNFRLFNAWSKRESGDRVVHLGYSDGLSVMSVFVQRGRLAPESVGTGTGLRPVIDNGGTVYVSDSAQQRRVWESGGFVYTVLADSRPKVATTAAEALPTPDGSGFWPRVCRGFVRLGSWVEAKT